MATYSGSLYLSGVTSYLREWAAFIRNAFLAAGWIQASDTGQTAPASFSESSGAWSMAGFMIFRMDDSLQSTYPVFVKIELGFGSSSGNSFGAYFTLGTGTDGAGNLTGVVGTRFNLGNNSNPGAYYASYASGDTNRISMALGVGAQSAANELVFSIERIKDIYGNDTPDGVVFQGYSDGSYSGFKTQVVPFDGSGMRSVQAYPAVPIPQNSVLGSLASGNSIGFVPILPFGLRGPYNPGSGMLLYNQVDWSALCVAPVVLHGETHNYLIVGYTNNNYVGWPSHSFAIRYE